MNITTDAIPIYEQPDSFTTGFNDSLLTATNDKDNIVSISIGSLGEIALGELIARPESAVPRMLNTVNNLLLRAWCASPWTWVKGWGAITMTPMKKAAVGGKTTTATALHYATNFIAAEARQASEVAAFITKPCAGIDRRQYRAVGAVLKFSPVLENTIEVAGNLPDSEVFSRPEFGSAGFSHLHDFGRDGLVREAGRMATSMFSTSRPPVALEKAASGLQSQVGAEAMTTVNTTPTPKTGNTSPLIRQQAIETALALALHLVRCGDIEAALGRTIRAASMLKQTCCERATAGRAA